MEVLACIRSGVPIRCGLHVPGTSVQGTVEGLLLIDPELKVAFRPLGVATKGRLWFLLLQHITNLSVGDIANLEVFLLYHAFSITHAILLARHHSVAGIVSFADVAVDTLPTLVASAWFITFSRKTIVSFGQRATEGQTAIFATESRRAGTSTATLGAIAELQAGVIF